ncbi:hypothetical protein LTR37_011992 [Vermiconidia calcicola]|uniref:Uncharacterized protein n=1 Tax=Vermiconidia calcicola TaxID=1690605 RepID=A0ACC3N173_9PEZI|nr:hypothetical protein LTR37_011992 [Vermiconidia calcicola]
MNISRAEGFLEVNEGSVYWTYTSVEAIKNESRPVLLFLHPGVADHTLWDEQVDYLTQKGWSCLAFDLLGFGQSHASVEYLRSDPRRPFDPIRHVDLLREQVLPAESAVVPIGLSIGGSLALGYTVNRPEYVSGAIVIAGGLLGFEHSNTPQEERLFALDDSLILAGDVQGAANLRVRIWGDGPLQEPGRMREDLADMMLKWNIEISARECAKTGGCALDTVTPEKPAGTLLHAIDVPVAVSYGVFDETYTTAAMKYLADKVPGATIREFRAAHMVNLEARDEFNKWLSDWLETNFLE